MPRAKKNSRIANDATGALASGNGSTFNRLRTALVDWRAAERKHATYVLRAAHPLEIRTAADAEAYALREVRLIVDSEPWAAILQDL